MENGTRDILNVPSRGHVLGLTPWKVVSVGWGDVSAETLSESTCSCHRLFRPLPNLPQDIPNLARRIASGEHLGDGT